MATTTLDRPAETGADPCSGFVTGLWNTEINVRDFIQLNVSPYFGDESFLEGATERTKAVWAKLEAMFPEEREKGVYAISQIPGSITAHDAGYIDQDKEIIVGLQTDAPLKRAIMPNGGYRMGANAPQTHGYKNDPAGAGALPKKPQNPQNRGVGAYTAAPPPR